METNKEEALRALELAKQNEDTQNYEKALKYYKISHRMYPTEETRSSIERVEHAMKGNHTAKRHVPQQSSAKEEERSTSPEPENHPPEHIEAVQRVLKCKTHYEVLGVSKTATEVEIKKQYKKLALNLHPDKNKVKGSEDAFKKVSQAFSVLSNEDKRKMYDLGYSTDDASPAFTRARNPSHMGDINIENMTPEEIFMMFFGGGFPVGAQMGQSRRAGNTRFYYSTGGSPFAPRERTTHTRANVRTEEGGGSSIFACLQLLPLLLLLLLSLFSGGSDPVYQFEPSSKYDLGRMTPNGVNYFVPSDYIVQNVAELERQVENQWVREMNYQCNQQRRYRSRPACEKLDTFWKNKRQ